MAENTPQNSYLPADAANIDLVSSGERPRTATVMSKMIQAAGYIGTFLGSIFTREVVTDLTKENTAAYEITKSDGLRESFLKGIKQPFDLKLWKSNVTQWATLFGGIILTDLAVKKIEQGTFKKRHGTLPRMDQVEQILDGTYEAIQNPQPLQSTNWQNKTIRKEDPQPGLAAQAER